MHACRYLKKIADSAKKNGVCVDDSLHRGLNSVMTEFSDEVKKKYSADSFHRLFWEQQMKAMTAEPTQRRWHPMLIR